MSNLTTQSGSQYTDQQRREAVAHYLVTGNLQATANALNIPRRTLFDWKQQPYWEQISNEIRQETKDRALAHLDSIVDKAYTQVIDRIENGDDIVHQGEVVGRKRMAGKDLAVVGSIAVDKRQLLLNQPTSIRADSTGMTDLVRQFEALSQRHAERVVSEQ